MIFGQKKTSFGSAPTNTQMCHYNFLDRHQTISKRSPRNSLHYNIYKQLGNDIDDNDTEENNKTSTCVEAVANFLRGPLQTNLAITANWVAMTRT